jgi:hypothetical protein
MPWYVDEVWRTLLVIGAWLWVLSSHWYCNTGRLDYGSLVCKSLSSCHVLHRVYPPHYIGDQCYTCSTRTLYVSNQHWLTPSPNVTRRVSNIRHKLNIVHYIHIALSKLVQVNMQREKNVHKKLQCNVFGRSSDPVVQSPKLLYCNCFAVESR